MVSEFVDFLVRYKFVILFYVAVVLFVFLRRSRFEFHFKVIALYKTNWGLALMERLASKYRELIKLAGYIGIGVGFIGMVFIIFVIIQSVYTLFTVPDAPPALMPVLPGVHIPGVPETFFIPLVQGLIAIFIVAVVHEFSHGVVARAHGIRVKKTGLALIGPFFAAFVEPDERELKKRDDVTNYSILAAGPVSNILTFLVLFVLMSVAINPVVNAVYDNPAGISFSSITGGAPADVAGLEKNVAYTIVNNQPVLSVDDFLRLFDEIKPGEDVIIANSEASYVVAAGANPSDSSKPYLGVSIYSRVEGDTTAAYAVIAWFMKLLSLVGVLSLGIGIANLLPIGLLDGGKMLQQALHKLRGEKKGNKTLVRVSLLLLFIVLLLLTPIFRETAKAVLGAS
ncbi:site-2 protease family protein [Candidatus Woesearchaeota archaeon]|nr:site-2 protease family protein [Candidatus Woesearchaeota archaeon]